MKFPHFDFYVRDWLNDLNNRALTREERSVHIDLLAMMWQQENCMLPDNDRAIASLLGASLGEWQTWRADLIDGPLPVLCAENGFIFSPRLVKERAHAMEVSKSKTRGAQARWSKQPSVSAAKADAYADPHEDAYAVNADMHSASTADAIHLTPNNKERESNARARTWGTTLPDEVANVLDALDAREDHAPILIHDAELLAQWHAQGVDWTLVLRALAYVQKENKPFAYAAKMLKSWFEKGVRTPDDLLGHPAARITPTARAPDPRGLAKENPDVSEHLAKGDKFLEAFGSA